MTGFDSNILCTYGGIGSLISNMFLTYEGDSLARAGHVFRYHKHENGITKKNCDTHGYLLSGVWRQTEKKIKNFMWLIEVEVNEFLKKSRIAQRQ